jgi:DNA-directed RNA polymerase subunit E'/Rpb7
VPDHENDADEMQREAALREATDRSRLLEANQEASRTVNAQVRAHITQQSIEDVRTSDNSVALVGLPEAVIGQIDQRIKGVETTNHSKAHVGVFSDAVNARDFL